MTESELSWGCQCPSKCGKVMFPLGLCVVAEECGYIALSSRSPGAATPQLPWAGAAEASHGVSNARPAQPPLHSCSLRATLGCSAATKPQATDKSLNGCVPQGCLLLAEGRNSRRERVGNFPGL